MTSDNVLADSYIMLTPTAATSSSRSVHSTPASDLRVRKRAAAANRKASNDETTRTGEDEGDDVLTREGPDCDAGNENKAKEKKGKREEEEIPTYVCELHDPKPLLDAEHIPCNRVDIKPCETRDRLKGLSEILVFHYEIVVGRAQQTFKCSPSTALEIFEKLSRDKKCAHELRFIELNCLKGGFIGSLRRIYASALQISTEIKDFLEAISDVDAVLMNQTYLNLVGAAKESTLRREIEKVVESHSNTSQSNALCMCDTYYKSVKRYGEFCHEQASANQTCQSIVASETLMRSRGVLSYFTDTIYLMDKRQFRPTHGLKQCSVYGFGRRKLFEIVRVSRKQWSLRHMNYGEILTLSLKKYAGGVHHMVEVKRMVPMHNGELRQENICFVKKSKSQGYRCLLMSEVISQGKVTTFISIEKPKQPPGDPNIHYMTMSEVSGPSPASVCSSTLSVPCKRYKHLQHLNVSGGSDVVTYIALAASYDILVRPLSYWMERKY